MVPVGRSNRPLLPRRRISLIAYPWRGPSVRVARSNASRCPFRTSALMSSYATPLADGALASSYVAQPMDYRSNGGVREPRSGHANPGRHNVSEIMTGIERPTDRQEIYDEMGAARATFHGLLDSMSPEDLRRPARDTKWNNEELLFHMLFGYIIVLSLIWIVKLFGWLPRPFSRLYSILLNLLT